MADSWQTTYIVKVRVPSKPPHPVPTEPEMKRAIEVGCAAISPGYSEVSVEVVGSRVIL